MKQITMDFQTYTDEMNNEHAKGYRRGIKEAQRIVLELLANADPDRLAGDYDSGLEHSFIDAIAKRMKEVA